jgi:hypothetical protein
MPNVPFAPKVMDHPQRAAHQKRLITTQRAHDMNWLSEAAAHLASCRHALIPDGGEPPSQKLWKGGLWCRHTTPRG